MQPRAFMRSRICRIARSCRATVRFGIEARSFLLSPPPDIHVEFNVCVAWRRELRACGVAERARPRPDLIGRHRAPRRIGYLSLIVRGNDTDCARYCRIHVVQIVDYARVGRIDRNFGNLAGVFARDAYRLLEGLINGKIKVRR